MADKDTAHFALQTELQTEIKTLVIAKLKGSILVTESDLDPDYTASLIADEIAAAARDLLENWRY